MLKAQGGCVGNGFRVLSEPHIQPRPWRCLGKANRAFSRPLRNSLSDINGVLPAIPVRVAYHLVDRRRKVATVIETINPSTIKLHLGRQGMNLTVKDLLGYTVGQTLLVQRIKGIILRQNGLPTLSGRAPVQ